MKKNIIDKKELIIIILLLVTITILVAILLILLNDKDNKKNNNYFPEQKENLQEEQKDQSSKEEIDDGGESNTNNTKPEVIKSIPDVSGLSVSEATEKLYNAGYLTMDIYEEVKSSKIEKGKVVKTDPPANAKRKSGTVVTIYISLGDDKILIENYTGKNYLEVKGKLETLGLYVTVEKKDIDNIEKYKNEVIIDQSIKAGEKLSKGDIITLYIPNIINKYPNFTDGTWSIKEIREFADLYNLQLSIEYESIPEYKPEDIFYQSKPEGYQIVAGQTFKIKVAK